MIAMFRKFFIDMICTEWVEKVAIIMEISKTATDLFSQRAIDADLGGRYQSRKSRLTS
tara:strand:- start:421 stop:594 length:174 start_codon:yes stop_codon:yes gene_type:complete